MHTFYLYLLACWLTIGTMAEKEKTPEALAEILKKCKELNPMAINFDTKEIAATKETVECYIKCLYEEIGLINANFTVNPPVFASLFKSKRLNENAIECLKKHPMQAATAEDICEVSFKFYDCIRQKSPKILKRAIYLYYQTTLEEMESKLPQLERKSNANDTMSVEELDDKNTTTTPRTTTQTATKL